MRRPHHVGIIANGNGVNVHHCIFRGLKISVVYWTPGSTGHAMTNCLCHKVYGSGVWTAGIAGDFLYRNNVVTGWNYVWTAQGGTSARADAGAGGGQAATAPVQSQALIEAAGRGDVFCEQPEAGRVLGTGAQTQDTEDLDASFLKLTDTTTTNEAVELERDSTKLGPLPSRRWIGGR